MSGIKVLIVDDIANTREDLKRLLYFEEDIEIIGEAADGEEAIRTARELKPDVILMDVNLPHLDGISATEQVTMLVPESAVIIISIQGEQEYLRKAMAAGAREYLVKPFSANELADTIRRVNQSHKKRSLMQTPGTLNSLGPVPPPPQGKVITFFSTKGGVGKTTLASNLAVSLAQETNKKVVLVDFDLTGGDVAILLNINTSSSIADLVQESDKINYSFLDPFLIAHLTGTKILTAPQRPEQAELINPGHIEQVINILKEAFDFIIIDTAPIYSEINLTVLEKSNLVLLVLTQDLAALKHTKNALDILGTLNYTARIKVVLNKAQQEGGIKISDMEKSLNTPMTAIIPDDQKTVLTAINKGLPFTMTQTNSKITFKVKELINLLYINDQEEEEPQPKKSIISRLFTF